MDIKQLGPYRIERRLGRGGMGTVYAGVEAGTGRVAAIKVLSDALADDEGFRERFEAEIETLKKLRHPNIVRLYGYGEHAGHLFYSMELVDGTNIEEELEQGRRFNWRETAEIGIKLSQALKHAHDRGVVHRDIKPANLMIASDGEMKLSDFGIAKLFGATGMTVAGGVLGTAEYMAPEQAEGKQVTPKVDLYSVGGVLYALLAGRPPFQAKSLPQLLQMQRFAEPDPVSHYASDVPEELEHIIGELLAKDPEARITNANLLGRRLTAMVRGLSLPPGLLAAENDADAEADLGRTLGATEFGLVDESTGGDDGLGRTMADSAIGACEVATAETALPSHAAPEGDGSGESAASGVVEARQRGLSKHFVETQVAGHGSGAAAADEAALDEGGSGGLKGATAGVGTGAVLVGSADVTAVGASATAGFEVAGQAAPLVAPDEDDEPRADRFTTVDERELDQPPERQRGDWLNHAWQVGVLGLMLAGLGAGGWYMVRPESADVMYGRLSAYRADDAESMSTDSLLTAADDARAFAERYPDDERVEEVTSMRSAMRDEVKLRKLRQQMESAARNGTGLEELTLLEQTYVEAIGLLPMEPERARVRLRSLLAVFAGGNDSSSDDRNAAAEARLVLELARRNLRDLEVEPNASGLREALTARMAYAKSLEAERAREVYQGIIALYEGRPWAEAAVKEARRELEAAAARDAVSNQAVGDTGDGDE